MATKIEVINRALVKIGSERLMSETDNNKASRTIEAIYDGLLDRLLRNYRWAFAIKRVQIAPLSDHPVYGYRFAYQLPSDCLRIDAVGDNMPHHLHERIHNFHGRPLWQREGNTVVTDIEPPMFFRYGARITDPSQWDAAFTDAFCCFLASEMAEAITQSSTKKQAALQDLQLALSDARQSSAIERPPVMQHETSWFTARL
ncbi:hypothetical protein [Tatumella punctata]|uniref:Uncharacterized protein n=1 Tax=Tatumella punctata TaxID=399969 RepID=A0ABW1VPM0_9GAMM